MDCAHTDSLNIKNYMWHYSPYLWLTTHFLCSFPLRSIMIVAILIIRACSPCLPRLQRPWEHPLSIHWKTLLCVTNSIHILEVSSMTAILFHSRQPDNEVKRRKCLKQNNLDIKVSFAFDQPHSSWSLLIFPWTFCYRPALPEKLSGFSLCV